jgi:signal transduction histidine kinase
MRGPRARANVEDVSDGFDELYQVSQAVLSVTRQMSVRDVLQVIVRSARSLVGARYAAIGVPDTGDSFAEFVVDGISPEQWQAIGPLPRRHGMLAVLLNEGQPERLADIRADSRFEGWPAAHPDMSHFLGMPVRDGDQVLGIIFAANKTPVPSSAEGNAGSAAENAGSGAGSGAGFTRRDEEILSLFAAHAAIALTNARLYERSRELSVLQERSRLARELHDAVTQKLFSIRAHARATAVLAARDPVDLARVRAEIEVVGTLGAEAHAELRAVIDGLAPPDLEAAGLVASVRSYAGLAGRAYGVPVTFTAAELPPLDPRAEVALYRVGQEALHNALRHAGAACVRVVLSRTARRVVLEVADDGHGFVPEMPSGGLGLASMRDRAAAAGGLLTIRSSPAGTHVRMTVPVKAGPVKGGPVKAGRSEQRQSRREASDDTVYLRADRR